MFTKNEGNIDRIIRVVVGALLLIGYFMNGDATYGWLYLLGIIPLVTGLVGFCPLYMVLGISTCPMKDK